MGETGIYWAAGWAVHVSGGCFVLFTEGCILCSVHTEELLWRSTVGQLDVSVVGSLAVW